MQHRDKIILDKIIDEANIATKMLSDVKQENFVSDDILKRAAAMSVIHLHHQKTRPYRACFLYIDIL